MTTWPGVSSLAPAQAVTTVSCIPGTSECTTRTFFPTGIGSVVIVIPTTVTTTTSMTQSVTTTNTQSITQEVTSTLLVTSTLPVKFRNATTTTTRSGAVGRIVIIDDEACNINEYEEVDVETGHSVWVVEIGDCIGAARQSSTPLKGETGLITSAAVGIVIGAALMWTIQRRRQHGQLLGYQAKNSGHATEK